LHLLEGGQTVGAVNLGAGRGYSIREVLATTGEVLGRPVPYSVAARREGDPSRLVADPSLARSMLDWTARRSDLATIIEDAARSRGARAFAGEHPTVASSVL
jgi:UDP-glucose 4-epimerase